MMTENLPARHSSTIAAAVLDDAMSEETQMFVSSTTFTSSLFPAHFPDRFGYVCFNFFRRKAGSLATDGCENFPKPLLPILIVEYLYPYLLFVFETKLFHRF